MSLCKSKWVVTCVFIIMGLCSCAKVDPDRTVVTEKPIEAAKFIVFDGTLYKNKPSLIQYGIKPIHIVYVSELWEKGKDINSLPTVSLVREAAHKANASKQITVLDIEQWNLQGEEGKVTENLIKYLIVLKWFRDAAPGIPVGYFARTPVGDYWRAIKGPGTPGHLSWQAENNRLEPLACQVNALFPHMYTALDDREDWIKVIIANIQEARRYSCNKPVYVFLWPQYSEHNSLKKYQYLPPDYWKLQLEIARQYADGIVIWGGWDLVNNSGPMSWDENAPWWGVTKKFMEELKY